jgi:hypothetical protein
MRSGILDAKFLNFRHTGASRIAQRGRDPRHLLAVVKMMGIPASPPSTAITST